MGLSRMVGAFAAGRILNAKTARSQFPGVSDANDRWRHCKNGIFRPQLPASASIQPLLMQPDQT